MNAILRHPLGPALAALVMHAGLLAGYVMAPKFGGDVSALACVGREKLGREPFEHVRVGFEPPGYDGQYYYALARNPWRKHTTTEIDKPAFRHLRLLYPAASWLASGGDPELLFWVLPGINLLAIAGIAGVGGALAMRFGRSSWWGVLLPLAVNAGMPALRDLTDPLATFTVVFLLAAWLCRWPTGWLTLAGLLAVLAREQNVAVVAIVLLMAIVWREWGRALGLLLALALWAGWAYVLWKAYGESPLATGNFTAPLEGMLQRWRSPSGQSFHGVPIHQIALMCLGIELIACLLMPLFNPEWTTLLIGWAGVALAVVAGWPIYEGIQSYLRVFPWAPLALWMWAAHSGRAWPFIFTLPLMPWSALAAAQVWQSPMG